MNTAIIAANFADWLLYELPKLDAAVTHASFYACTVDGSCHGKNVEDAFGHLRYLVFGFVFGLVAARLFLLLCTRGRSGNATRSDLTDT